MGIPRDPDKPLCSQCKETYRQCIDGVNRGTRRCMKHYRQQARTWCIQTKRKKFGKRLEGNYTCEPIEDVRGKPREHCFGPGIDDCIDSFAEDQPHRSVENTNKVNIGEDWWGVGGDQSSTVTWGGSRGFVMGCHLAAQEAGAVCLAGLDTCEEEAGECE